MNEYNEELEFAKNLAKEAQGIALRYFSFETEILGKKMIHR